VGSACLNISRRSSSANNASYIFLALMFISSCLFYQLQTNKLIFPVESFLPRFATQEFFQSLCVAWQSWRKVS
jgi:hypothetical protein